MVMSTMTGESAMSALCASIAKRHWARFHSSEILAKSIAIEAGELLEEFQWSPEFDADRVRLELTADLTYSYQLTEERRLDPEEIILEK